MIKECPFIDEIRVFLETIKEKNIEVPEHSSSIIRHMSQVLDYLRGIEVGDVWEYRKTKIKYEIMTIAKVKVGLQMIDEPLSVIARGVDHDGWVCADISEFRYNFDSFQSPRFDFVSRKNTISS